MSRRHVRSGSPFEEIAGFCRAVRVGNHITVAGTAPLGPDGKTVEGGVIEQARRCFTISLQALEELDAGVEHVVRTRIMLTRIEDWEAVARIHGEFFGTSRPACTVVQVAGLIDRAWFIETEVDAVVDD